MLRLKIAIALLALPMAAMAQTGADVSGQQDSQPSPNPLPQMSK